MTTPKLANLYENNELIDFYEMGNDSDNDDTNLGFDIPKRFTDFNKGFNNAEEFLALNDSLVERFPQFQSSIFEYIANNNSEPLDTTVNKTLDPANQNSGLYTVVSDDFKNNLSKFFELPEEDKTNIISTLKDRKGLFSDESWVNAELNIDLDLSEQKSDVIPISDGMLKYIGFMDLFEGIGGNKNIPLKRPSDRIEINKLFKEQTGYTFQAFLNNDIPMKAIETPEFQLGLDNMYKFYEDKGFTVKIPERTNLTKFEQTLKGLGVEIGGGFGLDYATQPLLSAGPYGIAAYVGINALGGGYLNYLSQEARLGQQKFIGQKDKLKWGELIGASGVQTIPFGVTDEGFKGIGKSFAFGGFLTGTETTIKNLIDEKEFPTFKEYLFSIGLGGGFAASFKSGLEFFDGLVTKFKGKSPKEISKLITDKEVKDLNKFADDTFTLQKQLQQQPQAKVNKTKDKPQINPKQVGDPEFTDARVQSLINKGVINTTIKSRTETLDAAIHLKNDPNFKEIVNKVAKDRKITPSDEFQLAIALEITSLNNGILDVNQKLINALNVKNDKKEVTILVGNLIDEINKLDEFLGDAIPLRSDQGSGLAIMQMPTEGLADMTPEKWNSLTEIQKKDWLKLKSGGIAISTDIANKDLVEISDAINNALKIYNETGDPKTLNKLVNTIKRVDGNYTKMNKLIKYGVLANIANADVINRPFRVINEVWLSAILYGPDTHLVNTLSSAIEGIVANSELYLDPKNLTNPRELEVAIKHSWNLLTGFDFALKGAMESFKLESNYFTGASKLDDFKDRIAFSMDGDGPIANIVNGIGKYIIRLPYKALTSEDAFFQGLSINASAYSGATLQGIQKGLKGKELQAYINKQAETIIETFATKTTKRINSLDPTQKKEAIELYETVKDFGKRSTFSEDLTGGGIINETTKWLAEGSAKSPIVRRFIPFVRILKNLVGRQIQRTPILGQTPFISGFYNDYVNGSPLLQKQLRGRVVLSTLTGSFIWSQMEKLGDPNSDVFLTGGGPSRGSREQGSSFNEAFQQKWDTGWRPYSIGFKQFNEDGSPKIGADGNPVIKYYSFTRLDPISGLLMAYTDAYDVSKLIGDGEIDEALAHIAVSGTRNLTDRLFLQGINDFAKLIYEPKRAENWFARQVASNVPASGLFSKAKNLPSDLYDMGLLDWTGVTADQALQWKLELNKKVYKGDEGLAIANKILNQLTRTIPGWNNNLPPMREHITNNPIFKRQRPSFDLLTWFEVSESKNNPILTVFSKLGKGVSEPTDTITTYGGSIDGQVGIKIEPVELDTQQMSDLQYITNTIDINGKLEGEKGYNGRTLKKTMLQYMKTPWFKTNYEIIKDVKKPWRTHPEIVEAILNGPPKGKLAGFREINNDFKIKAKDKFLELNPKILFKHDEAKKQSKINYIELLKKVNERIEY